jgi:acyl carrier protein
MEKFYSGLAEILEIDATKVSVTLDLTKLAWDSLAVIATIALADECFGVMLNGTALGKCNTVADIETLVEQAR